MNLYNLIMGTSRSPAKPRVFGAPLLALAITLLPALLIGAIYLVLQNVGAPGSTPIH